MSKKTLGGILIFVGMSMLPPRSDASWDNPDDIPATEPVTIGLAGEKPADIVRYLMADGADTARISPDGSQVAYEWSITGEPQLWIVDAEGGAPRQITFGRAITFFRWAPEGRNLIVGRDMDGNGRDGYFLISADGTKEKELLPLSDAFRAFGMFSPDGDRILYSSTERNGVDYDIYGLNLETGESRLIVESRFGFFPMAWQPGGDIVVVSETRGEDANDVHFLDVASGELTPKFHPEDAALYEQFAWLPDGSGFFMATNQDREYAGLAYYSVADDRLDYLSTPDFDVSNVELSGDGRFLVWTTNEGGYYKLHAMDRLTGTDLTVPEFPPGEYELHFSSKASVLSIFISGPRTPGDVWTWDLQSGTRTNPVRSSLAGLVPENLVLPISLRFQARDGVTLHGLLYLPDASVYDQKPPVVVDVHGGPTAQALPNFQFATQYLVNRGIAVFDVNVRGSTGFGKTFTRLDNREKRLDSVRDLVDTMAFLSRDGRVDSTRAAVMGGSYGGYMANAVLGLYPGVFDAGISRVGVSNWVRALQEASPALKASDRIEYGDIRQERWQRFYEKYSPINEATKITVPLLVEHGVNDPQDPVAESDRLVLAIREAGGTVEYLRFPDEGHSLDKKKNRIAYYRRVAEFLDRYLVPEQADIAAHAVR
ncbi:MAG: prolyl oligopeptidase family serine peptidase [Woeseia sp.]